MIDLPPMVVVTEPLESSVFSVGVLSESSGWSSVGSVDSEELSLALLSFVLVGRLVTTSRVIVAINKTPTTAPKIIASLLVFFDWSLAGSMVGWAGCGCCAGCGIGCADAG